MKKPLVSVIIPVYNGETYLAEALESVLQQNYEPIEIIIVDDGSTDKTAQIVKNIKGNIKYSYQTNQGPAAARNTGLRLASGEFIAFLDVDDLWSRNRLTMQADFLIVHPAVEIIQGLIQDLHLAGSTSDSTSSFKAVSEPYFSVNLGGAMYRRQVFDKVGLFDETLRYNEDTDWFVRAWDNNITKAQLAKVALYYRKHESNMTRQNNSRHFGLVRLLKKRLDHQRAKGNDLTQPALCQLHSITKYIGWTQ